jgi:acyl-CoA synthetase (NDP forming)/GNAT superfamily N-acetyltransferase
MDAPTRKKSPQPYPRHWEADVVLRDGATAHVRPVMPDDAPALRRFFHALSPGSLLLRFFTSTPEPMSEHELVRLTEVDHVDRVTLLALLGDDVVGVAEYERREGREAEVAFTTADSHHGRGLGSVLLEHLAAAARERRIERFVAKVLPENKKMLGVFRDAGYEVTRDFEFGVVALDFHIDPTDRSRAVMEAREHRSEAASLRALLTPRSVAVVGASRNPDSVGAQVLRHVLDAGFPGAVHAVNPHASEVQGVPSYPAVSAIPSTVDVVVVAVPVGAVLDVVRDCGRAGVRGLVVMSGGFAEADDEGLDRQAEMVRVSRAHGMRVIGPMSMGLLNTDPDIRLNLSLADRVPVHGGLGLFSQSGALGLAVLASADRRRLGISCFISAGNRADVSGNDCLQYMEEDPNTAVVGLYLESIGNPRKFSRIARRLSRSKPVVVVKSGMSGYGVPPGHVVRASRAPREALDAMLRQAGVVRVDNVHQLFDVAQLLLHQPAPAGSRIGIVGNSIAMAALVADAVTGWGMEVGAEPVTVTPQATAQHFREALERAYAEPGTDAVVACFVPPLGALDDEVVRALMEVAATSAKPTVACLLGMRGVQPVTRRPGPAISEAVIREIPTYPTPEDAVLALAAAVRYAQWLRLESGTRVDPPGIDRSRARSLVERLLLTAHDEAGVQAGSDDLRELLACYGVPLSAEIAVEGEDEAVQAAETLGWPVLLMTADQQIRRSRRLRGTAPDIDGPAELRAQLQAMRRRIPQESSFVVQRMPAPGVRCVVRTMEDVLFGPVVSFGLAGLTSDLLGDVSHRIPPLTDVDVKELIRSVRAAQTLTGYLDSPPLDVPALEDVVARLSCLADDLPEVCDLEVNPLLVSEKGVTVVSATARLASPTLRRSDGPQRGLLP